MAEGAQDHVADKAVPSVEDFKQSVPDEAELMEALEDESRLFDKSAEIDRILKAHKFNGYEVLDLTSGVGEDDVKRTYRKKSLLIHPDKTTDKRAPEAFDLLKKANTQLLDEKEREKLDEAIAIARRLTMRDLNLDQDDERVKDPDEEFRVAWKRNIFKVTIEEEERRKRKLKAQMQEEGRQQRKEQEEQEERLRKRKYDQAWEATRDGRIGSWRDFQKGSSSSGPATSATGNASSKPVGKPTGAKKAKKLKTLG